MKGAMATAKNDVCIGLWNENCYLMGGWIFIGEVIEIWWGGSLLGVIFPGVGRVSKFLANGGTHPHPLK